MDSQPKIFLKSLLAKTACKFSLKIFFNKLKKKNIYFILNYSLLTVVIVSGEQQRDSAMCRHVSILPLTPIPSKLPHDIEQSSLGYTAGP